MGGQRRRQRRPPGGRQRLHSPLYAAWGRPASLAKPAMIDGDQGRPPPVRRGGGAARRASPSSSRPAATSATGRPPASTGCIETPRANCGPTRSLRSSLGLPRHGGDHKEAWANQSYITGLALSDDASQMAAGVCTRGYCGGLGFPTADAQTTLYRSSRRRCDLDAIRAVRRRRLGHRYHERRRRGVRSLRPRRADGAQIHFVPQRRARRAAAGSTGTGLAT